MLHSHRDLIFVFEETSFILEVASNSSFLSIKCFTARQNETEIARGIVFDEKIKKKWNEE